MLCQIDEETEDDDTEDGTLTCSSQVSILNRSEINVPGFLAFGWRDKRKKRKSKK